MEYGIDTLCVQAGYSPKNGEPRILPIYQSTTYKYDSGEDVGKLFDLEEEGHMYSRISNPTVDCVEKKIAALEGGVGALCTSSGQAATLLAVLNICSAGQHIISTSSIYGGTVNLFSVTMKRMGIDVSFISADASDDEFQAIFRDNTRLVFTETIANPSLVVADIERLAAIAHRNGVPLIVDNTFATPVLCRPFEFGADIVVHSTSKYMDGHAAALGGVIVDGGSFNWSGGRFQELYTPDESYHGVVYTEKFGAAAFINKARVQLLRDIGATPTAMNAFLLNLGLETLHLRIRRHSENALRVAGFLEEDEKIAWVNYPGLKSSKYYGLAQKYFPEGASGVISFGVRGGRDKAMKLMDSLRLASIVVHVADARSSCLHPASTTHRQLTDEQLINGGVLPEMVRFSVGIEDAADIIEDLRQALNSI